ncbi:MAG: formylglycine-generating enzyme family protein [Planctomycetia bacterium]|nr:formylglycine-generating enzyme family protein [Planctomycetia bacterium]
MLNYFLSCRFLITFPFRAVMPAYILAKQNMKKMKIHNVSCIKFFTLLMMFFSFFSWSVRAQDTKVTPENSASAVKEGQKAGERLTKTVDGVEYSFRWCPAGSFLMGAPEGEIGRDPWDIQHKVTLTRGYWMLETEVTQQMWENVMAENPSQFKGADRPVENVNWKDCQNFCQKLRDKGLNVFLPTEAQWEYAARAGTVTSLCSGKNITTETGTCPALHEVCWYNKNSDFQTHTVAQKQPNIWGIYDMHGNVYEWCHDWKRRYTGAEVTDPLGSPSGTYRIGRGGSWCDSAKDCGSAKRFANPPAFHSFNLGLRVILVPSSE